MRNTTETLDRTLARFAREWARLFITLKKDICDDYRATDDPDDNTPGMCVTIGFTPADEERNASWGYQTGDNSYSGGAYSHPHWAVVYLYRRSNSKELASDAANQIAGLISQ
jgi:hypothetical protein